MRRTLGFVWRLIRVFGPVLIVLAVLAGVGAPYAGGLIGSLDPALRFIPGWLGSLIGVVFVVGGGLLVVGRFVRTLYGLDSAIDGASSAWRSVFGTGSFWPYVIGRYGRIEARRDEVGNPLEQIGGPGSILLYNDTAVVLEAAGRLTRVVKGPRMQQLGRFERVYAVIDLRPQRWKYEVKALTREGIPVRTDVDVAFQVDDGGQPPSAKDPYPALVPAILKAGTCTWMREANRLQDMDWGGRVVISQAEGTLRSLLARTPLDQLVPADPATRSGRRGRLQSSLQSRLANNVSEVGVKITGVYLGEVLVESEVAQQWLDIWRAQWKRWATEQIALGKAARLESLEQAKIDVQVNFLTEVGSRIRSAAEQESFLSASSLALQFLQAFSQPGELSDWAKIYLPSWSWQMIQRIRQSLT